MARGKSPTQNGNGAANLGFEAKLWLAADKLRNNMDAAEYKHVVLGLIFLKYISDTFEEHRAKLLAGKGEYAGANAEDQDEYKAENVFWVPKESRWSHLQASAKLPAIGKVVDDARDAPEIQRVIARGRGVAAGMSTTSITTLCREAARGFLHSGSRDNSRDKVS
jgi:type I restriction enzyme M protein